jgi:CrcB protein
MDELPSSAHDPGTREKVSANQRALNNGNYETPAGYSGLNEIAASAPAQQHDVNPLRQIHSLKEGQARGEAQNERQPQGSRQETNYDIPNGSANLDEVAAPPPVEDPREEPLYLHKSLEEVRNAEQEYEKHGRDGGARRNREAPSTTANAGEEKKEKSEVSKRATQLYTVSYLILFSIFGTLARLGLQAITFYPGAPVVFSVLWANFAGSLFMGFLSEDRKLFKHEWGTPTYDQMLQKWKRQSKDEERGLSTDQPPDLQAAKKTHAATKKTIPLYIGLATGFCGSFTSFSSFIRDTFLALSNDLPTPLNHPQDYSPVHASTTSTVGRNGGYSFMALLAVIITTVSLCLAALFIGAHLAIFLEPYTPSLPFRLSRKLLDPLAVFLAWGCWLGAVFLAIFPPDRNDSPPEIWRGRAVFALVFAPIGCLGRFYASLFLNGKISSFPLGTFVVNMFGTAVLGMAYDLQHVPLGGVVGCEVLQGIEDGFCGCLTTVSTWASELSTLRRSHAYRYGVASVVGGLCLLIVIMGSLRWTGGFEGILCIK